MLTKHLLCWHQTSYRVFTFSYDSPKRPSSPSHSQGIGDGDQLGCHALPLSKRNMQALGWWQRGSKGFCSQWQENTPLTLKGPMAPAC